MALWNGRKQSAVPAARLNGNPTGPFNPPPQQTAAFADPPPGYPVNNPLGWAPEYVRPTDGAGVRQDMRVDPTRPPSETWAPRDADEAKRHSVEDQDADGWTEQKGGSGKALAADPRRIPPPESRPTQQMAPRSYSFTRPFDQFNKVYADIQVGARRQLNGTHFSMASHKREYEILGMEPARRSRRNTFRLTPGPWDADLIDMPPVVESPYQRVRSVDVPPSGRAYRL